MCGIIGILGTGDVAGAVIDGLRRLEYRGYDSAGIAVIDAGGDLTRRRAVGKLENLSKSLDDDPLKGATAVGHTRWATHGAPTEVNAHPHATDRIALVHNGIIENFRTLREELETKGAAFATDTDTEVVVQLIDHNLQSGQSPEEAFKNALARLEGAFAIAVVFHGDQDLMAAARRGSPLAIGRKGDEVFLGSDAYALAPFTNRVTYLDEGDWAVMRRGQVAIFDRDGRQAARVEKIVDVGAAMVDKGQHRHFMAKEIYEQPEVIAHMIGAYADPNTLVARPPADFDWKTVSKLTISACGTAYYAGLIARYWFETLAGLEVEIDIASELRYRTAPFRPGGAALFISQSGETADTLAALKYAKERGQRIAALVNVPESSIAREADVVFPTYAGPEIGVASTKAFTCQLTALLALAIHAARQRDEMTAQEENDIIRSLTELPRHVSAAFGVESDVEKLAHELAKARDVIFMGRGVSFPVALEGALKLKEISYIHAEGYAAGELKHGPIALIDEAVPVVVVAPTDDLFPKTVSNMQEVIARGGKALLVSDANGVTEAGEGTWARLTLPSVHALLTPIVYAVPMQLLAYFTAVAKGTDVDQPRNLAKSVTVE